MDATLEPQDVAGELTPPAPPARTPHPGAAIVLLPDDASREALATFSGADVQPGDLHLTLFYLGPATEVGPMVAALTGPVRDKAAETAPLEWSVAGVLRIAGREGDDGEARPDTLALAGSSEEVYALRAWAEETVRGLAAQAGEVPGSEHAFLPHVSLARLAPGAEVVSPLTLPARLRFDRLALWNGGDEHAFRLEGTAVSVAAMTDATSSAGAPAFPAAPPSTEGTAPGPAVTLRVVPFDAGGDTIPTREGEDWNRGHAVGRLRAWASSDKSGDWSTMAWGTYARGFLYVDADRADSWDAYRLAHHDVIDGTLHVSRKGVLSAAASLMAGTSGIPEEDLEAARLHLELHCAQFGMDPPWVARQTAPMALSAAEELPPGVVSQSVIQVAKVGTFNGHRAGAFEFTPEVFDRIIANFARTTNRRVPIDYEHATERMDGTIPLLGAPAVGWIIALENRGELGLWATVEWVDATAVGYIREGRYKFFSPAVVFNGIDPVTGEELGPVLVSGALTNRPFLDGMAPLTARDGTLPETAADPSPVRRSVVAASASAGVSGAVTSDPAPGTPGAVSDAATPNSPAEAPVSPAKAPEAPAAVTASVILSAPRSERFRAAVVAAREGSGSTVALSWWDGEGFDDREDLLGFLRMMFGLPLTAGETEIRAALTRLGSLLADSAAAAAEGVDTAAILGDFRRCLNLPVLASGAEVIAAIESALNSLPSEAAPMSGASAQTSTPTPAAKPAATQEPSPMADQNTTPSPDAAALSAANATVERLTAELNAAKSAADKAASEHAAAMAAKDAELKTLSDRVAVVEKADAERIVDARIKATQIAASARDAAVSLCLSNRATFDALYPAPADPPKAETTPAEGVRTELSAAQGQRPGATVTTMNAGGPPAAATPTHGQRFDVALDERASALMKADSNLDYRAALTLAEAELRGGR